MALLCDLSYPCERRSTRQMDLARISTCLGHPFRFVKALAEVGRASRVQWFQASLHGGLARMALASLAVGIKLQARQAGPATQFFGWARARAPGIPQVDGEFLDLRGKGLPVWLSLIPSLFARWPRRRSRRRSRRCTRLGSGSESVSRGPWAPFWSCDVAISHGLGLPVLCLADRVTYRLTEKGNVEIAGPSGVGFWQE